MLKPETHAKLVATFKKDLTQLGPDAVVDKYILSGEKGILSLDQNFSLRKELGGFCGCFPHEVIVVGSAKLGFSIKPSRRYGELLTNSDIDVAIVSGSAFDRIWYELHRYSDAGGIWEHTAKFQRYFFRGWIRPDILPPGGSFPFSKELWQFVNGLSASR